MSTSLAKSLTMNLLKVRNGIIVFINLRSNSALLYMNFINNTLRIRYLYFFLFAAYYGFLLELNALLKFKEEAIMCCKEKNYFPA